MDGLIENEKVINQTVCEGDGRGGGGQSAKA